MSCRLLALLSGSYDDSFGLLGVTCEADHVSVDLFEREAVAVDSPRSMGYLRSGKNDR